MNPAPKHTLKDWIALFGPHEIIALAMFLATVMIWGVTIRVLITGC